MATSVLSRIPSLILEDLERIFSKKEDFLELKNSEIFLTGGTGFFGSWLLNSFVYINEVYSLNARIVALTRKKGNFNKNTSYLSNYPAIQILEGDVTDFSFAGLKPDYIIHAATPASAELLEKDPLAMFEIILNGMRHLMSLCISVKPKSFLHTSSGAVYGKQPTDLEKVDESFSGISDTMKEGSAYGVGKRSAELLSVLFGKKYNFPVKTARCYAFTGPYLPLDKHFAIGNFIQNAGSNSNIDLSGDGTPLRSYLYSADLAYWLWKILIKGRPFEAYNVGSDQPVSIQELAFLVRTLLNPNLNVSIRKKPVPGVMPERYVPSVDKAREELGLDVYTSLEEAIKKTYQFHFGNFNGSQ